MELSIMDVRKRERPVNYLTARGRRAATKPTRIFLFPVVESVIENLANRTSRPLGLYRKLIPQILTQAGLPQQKVRWSQYAGCSCPCSPGFICEESWGSDIFVDVGSGTASARVAAGKEPRFEAEQLTLGF